MKLKCRIKGKEYDIVQGATFTENFNETLDSGFICIDQVEKIKGLKPYDDVYIWDSEEDFNGYYKRGDLISGTENKTVDLDSDQVEIVETEETIDPITGEKYLKEEKKDNQWILSGVLVKLWIYYFMNYNEDTQNEFRYNPKIKITIHTLIDGGNDREFTGMELKVANSTRPFFENYDIDNGEVPSFVFSYGKFSFPCSVLLNDNKIIINTGDKDTTGKYIIQAVSIENDKIEYKENFIKTFTISSEPISKIKRFEKVKVSFLYRGTVLSGYTQITGGNYTNFLLFEWSLNKTISINLFSGRNENGKSFNLMLNLGVGGQIEAFPIANDEVSDYDYMSEEEKYFISFIDDVFFECVFVSDEYSKLPNGFYKHFLIDSFTKQRLRLDNDYKSEKALFSYQINLFSEIKKLEKIILPNISITQSIVQKEKRSCWFYLEEMINLYSPKYKKSLFRSPTGENQWFYATKYSVSDQKYDYLDGKNGIITNLEEVFSDVICPEMSFTNPNLRDVLSKIMITKDLIPIVFNDVIYGMNIGQLKQKEFNRNGTNFDVESMSSGNYATDARREYSGAISQEKTAHSVEYIGFRNPNDVFLTLDSMVLQTRFPIYKINSIKMCYYKKFTLTKTNADETTETKERVFMCKYDITPLVLQNVVRNTMSNNWEAYIDDSKEISYDNLTGTIEEKMKKISQYKMCTVGYDIGSNIISGWGTSYEYLTFLWFKEGKTYIENIVNLLENVSNIGTQAFFSELKENANEYTFSIIYDSGVDGIIPLNGGGENDTNKLKSIFFEIDYNAMYNGTVLHDKDFIEDDDITTVDNCSSSLTILESDGLFEKEKMNRMSNPIFKIPARYDNDNGGADFDKIQELSSYDDLTESTIYVREYQIYDNVILCNYEATKDYILKNYFTSVFAKYRTYSLMSYGESVKRSENFRQLITLSKDKLYYETENILDSQATFADLCSFLTPTERDNGRIINENIINCGYFLFNNKIFLSDLNSFACGNSLCFNLATYDNISGGVSIENLSSDITYTGTDAEKAVDYKCTQKWISMVEDDSDAFTENVGVYICHINNDDYYGDSVDDFSNFTSNLEKYSRRLLNLPVVDSNDIGDFNQRQSKIIGSDFKLNKDNKEIIDFTFQYSYIALEEDILLSPWVAKLNDLVGSFEKNNQQVEIITDFDEDTRQIQVNVYKESDALTDNAITFLFIIGVDTYDNFIKPNVESKKTVNISDFDSSVFNFGRSYPVGDFLSNTYKGENARLYMEKISNTTDDYFDVSSTFSGFYSVTQTFFWDNKTLTNIYFTKNVNLRFEKQPGVTVINGVNCYVFKYTCGSFGNDFLPIARTRIASSSTAPGIYVDIYWGMDIDTTATTFFSKVNTISAQTIQKNPNMYLIKSTKKLDKTLSYASFKTTNNYVYLPEGMFIDTSGLNNVESKKTVNQVFSLNAEKNLISVNASLYNGDENDIKSLQYYYLDESGYLNFVFGVNIEKNENGKYKDFNIYLSCISKRNMEVYDEFHNVVGKATNYINEDGNVDNNYKKGQFYKKEDD